MPDGGCDHDWQPVPPLRLRTAGDVVDASSKQATSPASAHDLSGGWRCARSGCWRGELGQEPDAAWFVAHLVEVFREVWRVLRGDGNLFVNLMGTYATTWSSVRLAGGAGLKEETSRARRAHGMGYPPKCWIPTPWLLGLGLIEAGWTLRAPLIWEKPNCMPESVSDRCTLSHEYLLHLTKGQHYFWDSAAIKEPLAPGSDVAYRAELRQDKQYDAKEPYRQNFPASFDPSSRNARSIWRLPTRGLSEAHFAVFPEALPTRCLLAATPEHGVCAECGAPYRRVSVSGRKAETTALTKAAQLSRTHRQFSGGSPSVSTTPLGWERPCRCATAERVPAVVLDPFAGSGSTLVAALRQGRRALGIELNPEYAAIAQRRCDAAAAQPRLPLEAV